MSFVGFLADHVCTARELILGRKRGRAMLHSCSQFPGNSGCQARIAASRRHEGGVIQPKLDPPFRPPAERAIGPNACCFHRGGQLPATPRNLATVDGYHDRRPGLTVGGKAVVALWRLLAPGSPDLGEPGQASLGRALCGWYIRQLLRRAYTLEYCWPSSGARRLPVEHYFGIRKMKVRRARKRGVGK